MTPDHSANCAVCGEAMAAGMAADCNWCGARFHLNQRNDVEGRDCGRVWIDEQHLGLQFACNSCLGGEPTGAESTEKPPRRRYRRRA